MSCYPEDSIYYNYKLTTTTTTTANALKKITPNKKLAEMKKKIKTFIFSEFLFFSFALDCSSRAV